MHDQAYCLRRNTSNIIYAVKFEKKRKKKKDDENDSEKEVI